MIVLAGMGRLSAVSCLSLGPTCVANAPRLAALDADLGLHVNFTEPLGFGADADLPSLSRLILRAYAGRLDADWVDLHPVSYTHLAIAIRDGVKGKPDKVTSIGNPNGTAGPFKQ